MARPPRPDHNEDQNEKGKPARVTQTSDMQPRPEAVAGATPTNVPDQAIVAATAPNSVEIISRLEALRDINYNSELCQRHREALLELSGIKRKSRRGLIVASGFIALLSGGSTAALIAPATDYLGVKLVAAALAFTAGIFNLISVNYFDEKEIETIYQGAQEYGKLRDRATIFLIRRAQSHKAIVDFLEDFRKGMSEVDNKYLKYFNVGQLRSDSEKIRDRIGAAWDQEIDAARPRPAGGGGGGGWDGFGIGTHGPHFAPPPDTLI